MVSRPSLSAGPTRTRDTSPQDVRDTEPPDAALSIETGREVMVSEDTPVPLFLFKQLRSGRHRRLPAGREPTSPVRPTRGQPTQQGGRGRGSPRALAPGFSRRQRARGAGPWWPTVRLIRAG